MPPGSARFSSTLSHMHTPSPPARPRLPGRRSTLALLLAALLVALAGSSVAARSLLLGISRENDGRQLTQLTDHSGYMGRDPALWSIWSQWGAPSTRLFPTSVVNALPAGVIPVIWWEPTDPRGDNWTKGRFERYFRINKGVHDEYIRQWARDAQASAAPRVIVRFAHEMNGKWFPWGIGRFDNTPKNFKAAWQRVWRLFKQEGALAGHGGKVELLWSVTKQNCPNCNPFARVYPGDKYVHWVGLTAFNWGVQKSWKSMEQVLASPIKDLQALTKKKIIVAELASHFRGGDKGKWIWQGYQRTHARWPKVKAVLYLDSGVPKQIWGHPDWRLVKPNDGSALAAYKALTADSRFQGSLPRP
jgi:mannan endo-1,4-beta-mannosidase